jgi:two-component system, chemotaxis family, protein-glutamate methylesterase/glutaminase
VTLLKDPSPSTPRVIEVLVIDDSKVARMLLKHVLEADPQFHVMGMIGNGQTAVEFVAQRRPDVILMDIHMPGMDGFETTRKIMETYPTPIVICTGAMNPEDAATAIRVFEAGGVACVEKPAGPRHSNFERMAARIRQTVRLMSDVKVVRRWKTSRDVSPHGAGRESFLEKDAADAGIRCVGIGASTGGPMVLQTILGGLPAAFPAPILIVQHIAHGFLASLADWLDRSTAFPVHIAAHGVFPLPGHAYLAPDGRHLVLGADGRICLSDSEPENGVRPAVSQLFRSLAHVCGPNAVGVMLTGMGRDGAAEMKELRDAGGFTIAQNHESSVVHGMPGQAIAAGAASLVLPAEKIAEKLSSLFLRE